MEEFYRIRRLPPYVFDEVNRAEGGRAQAGDDIIDLGMGNPDLPPPPHVIDKLEETLASRARDGYSASRGIPACARPRRTITRAASASKLDPDTEVVVTLGSKEGFANVAHAITAPGDVVLCPNPSYPIHTFGFIIAGGAIRSVPTEPTPQFRGARARDRSSMPKPLALVVCYPTNPTAEVATSPSTRGSSRSPRSTSSGCCRTSPIPKSISTASRRPRSCRCRARRTSRSSSPRCRRRIRWPAGASALRSATRR